MIRFGSKVTIKPDVMTDGDTLISGFRLINQSVGVIVEKQGRECTIKWDTGFVGKVSQDNLAEIR